MNYYQFHIGDYATHTAHLAPMEDLAYRRMIDLYYLSEEGFSDAALVARKVRSSVEIVQAILDEFFDLVDGVYRHGRCDAEISKYHAKAQSARNANQRRWASENKSEMDLKSDLKSDADQILTNNQEPITNNQEPNKKNTRAKKTEVTKPVDVSDQVWGSFLAVRKSKKAAVTELAILGIRREAVKAGIDLEDALTICCERGWAGFKAEWMQERTGRQSYQQERAAEAAKWGGAGRRELRTIDAEVLNVTAIESR